MEGEDEKRLEGKKRKTGIKSEKGEEKKGECEEKGLKDRGRGYEIRGERLRGEEEDIDRD